MPSGAAGRLLGHRAPPQPAFLPVLRAPVDLAQGAEGDFLSGEVGGWNRVEVWAIAWRII